MSRIYLFCCAILFTWQAQAGTTTTTATASPASLTFTYQSGAATLPAMQTISVKASSGTPSFTAAVSPADALWLTVSPSSGSVPGTLDVRVNPTGLSVGIYSTASITITVAGVTNPLSVPVTLTVTAPASTLALSAVTLSFAAPGSTGAQVITMSTNALPISFTATSGATWLLVSSGAAAAASSVTGVVVSPADPALLTVSINPTTLATLTPQTAPYVGKITVVASGPSVTAKSQTITVNLTVNSVAPTITGVWPANLPVGAGASWITITGTNFYSATVVKVSGVSGSLTPTILSSTQMLVQLPATMFASSTTLPLIASNPPPGGDSTPNAASTVTVANIPAIAQNGVVSAASYASDAIAPGELVTIFGTNIGPVNPAPMNIVNGYVSTSTAPASVSVTVDGQNAPIVYASQNQVNIQVPYEVTTGANKNLVVTNGANPAASTKVTINATAPGIFTFNGSGTGQAAALNYNSTTGAYSLNSSTTPANIGDIVILYLTGEGNYNPALLTGAVLTNTGFIIPTSMSPLPQLNPLPTVTIGGVDASSGVSYAGPVPGGMLGQLQINVTVPTGSATGAAVPVSVTIGGVSTQTDQPNVTLAIHQ